MPGHMYGAIPRTTETEPGTETETDTDTETVMGNRTFNIYVFGLSTRIRSYVRNLQYIRLRPEHAYTFVRTRASKTQLITITKLLRLSLAIANILVHVELSNLRNLLYKLLYCTVSQE